MASFGAFLTTVSPFRLSDGWPYLLFGSALSLVIDKSRTIGRPSALGMMSTRTPLRTVDPLGGEQPRHFLRMGKEQPH